MSWLGSTRRHCRRHSVVASAIGLLSALLLGGSAWASDVVEYVVTDALGNIRVIEDEQGNVIERHDYLAFGEECTTGPCAANPGVGAGQPRKFTGKERDQETGLDYFGARYYSPPIARFTTVDPVYTWRENLTDPQRWNRYAYARNNPLKYVDPDGKVIWWVAIPLALFYVANNPTPANVTTGPSVEPILPNSAVTAFVFGAYAAYAGLAGTPDPPSPDHDFTDVTISRKRSPEAARHVEDAQAAGHPDVVTIDRSRARPNRDDSLRGVPAAPPGFDRDEYPPACCAEGGAGASVRPIPAGDNRSAGAQLGSQLRKLKVPDGARVRIKPSDE